MQVKVFQTNHNGKIEFTRAELEKLLNEIYDGGFRDGVAAQKEKSNWTWTSPYRYSNNITLNATNGAIKPIDNLTCNYKQDTTTNEKTPANCAAATATLVDDIFSKLSKELNF